MGGSAYGMPLDSGPTIELFNLAHLRKITAILGDKTSAAFLKNKGKIPSEHAPPQASRSSNRI